MRRTEEELLCALPLDLETFIFLAQKRIREPVVGSLYAEFINNGTAEILKGILYNVPPEHRLPILYTLVTHVTKEKPVFVYGIGRSVDCIDEGRAKFVAASTDLLWCLSLMVDDIIDEDHFRAGRKTAWTTYGKWETYTSAGVAFGILQDLTAQTLSPEARQLFIETVQDGLESLKDPLIKDVDSNIEAILKNIDRRARFHVEYPVRALFADTGDEELIQAATNALSCVNRAGQILNDVKDLVPSQIYGRNLFSDIRGGTVTVPFIMLQNASTPNEKQGLRECFNCPHLTLEQIDWLQRLVRRRLPGQQIYELVLRNYEIFLETMRGIVAPKYFALCQEWVNYKMDQASKLLSN